MTITRRKSKAAEQETADSDRSLTLTLPDDIDEDALSNLLPETNLTSVSAKDVVALYQLLVTQAISIDGVERERDDARAEAERREVELDQALQDKESLSKEWETSVETSNIGLKEVTEERDRLVEDKAKLTEQVTTLSNSRSSTSTEVQNLKQRVEDTEREKRELIGVVSRLKEESTQREEEIHTLRANLKEARQEHQALETQIRELRSTETATKFKVDSLEQQLQLSQGEAERANQELISKTEEFAKYRRAKHSEVATLQASFDSLTQSHSSSDASLKALQSAHIAQGHHLTQSLSKVQDLTGQLAEQEARYSSEINGLKRLVTMMEEREKQAKEIVDSVELEWATVGEKADRREAALRDEATKERRARLETEKRLEQLEVVLDKMGRGELPVPSRSTPSTPFRGSGLADSTIDTMVGLSPTVAMASRVQRSGKTFTEVFADYVQLQEEYAKKCAEFDHMDRTLSSVLAQIEERAPILSQQRNEYERLQVEAAQLGSQLSRALTDRDVQHNNSQELSQKLAKSANENKLLQIQLDDLGRQVQNLLRQIARRDDPTIPSDEELEGIAVEAVTDAATLVTNHLVLFKNIEELQRQNIRLLKIVRDLGEKMESDEREYRETMEKEQAEAIREAHEAMQELAAQLETQKQHSDTVIKAYLKERDALKAMLAHSQVSTSVTSGVSVGGVVAPSSNLATELVEVQSQFDAYKLEMGIDSGRLRDELIATQRELNSMSTAFAKADAKVQSLSGRQRMQEEQFRVHNLELDEFGKRSTQLNEQNVRLDIECGRLSEELQVALSRLEQLRNDCANLRAEKKIWEGIQGRLVEENRSLSTERSRLADLMGNVQKMHNDMERSGENDRRRLESQLQMLENQTQDLQSRLLQERESVRHVTLQKDIEVKELQTRIEKSLQQFSQTRETLVEAQTSRKHLEEKVEDLIRQLKGNEEKLAVYERRPTGAAQPVEHDLSPEQQLEAEVAELRSALKVAEVDLAAAKSHKNQFQEISQASEAALVSLNATFDEYKASSEASIARYESQITSLQARLEQENFELVEIRGKLNEQQKTLEAERIVWINDKKTLEDTIVDLSMSEKQTEYDRNGWEQGLKELEERAKSAEHRYSQEIIAHAESMKVLEGVKKELGNARSSLSEQRTAAETAGVKLTSSEKSWAQQKEALDKEVADLNARCQELSQQNDTLHQCLESVSNQATKIRQATEADGETVSATDDDTKMSELRSVVSYLRKEKGIVDLQLEMSKRENGVLRNQMERLSLTLQETRTTLTEERERAVQNTASVAQHAELVERINQLNILRESNATLRTESEIASKKSRELETKLTQLGSELEPAKEQARSATAELEATKQQMQRLEQESRKWQERNSQLLSKYDRIDPAEVQSLKDKITEAKKEATEVQAKLVEKETALEASTQRLEAVEANLRSHKEAQHRTLQNFKLKMGELNKQVSTLAEEKRQLEAKVTTFEQENAARQAQPEVIAPATEEIQKLNDSLRAERDQLLAEKENWTKTTATTTEEASTSPNWESEKVELVKSRDDALEKLKSAEANSSKVSNENKNIKFQNDKFQARIQDLMKTKAADAEKQATVIAEAVEKAKAEMNVNPPSVEATEALVKRHAEELKALEEKLKDEHDVALKTAVEESQKNKPAEPSDTSRQAAIDAAVADVKQKAEAQLKEEIASAVERGRMEQTAKNKLKDSQLVKAQKRVKELEQQIHEWQAAGGSNTPTSPTTGTGPSTSIPPTQPAPKLTAPSQQATNQQTPADASTSTTQPKPPATASTTTTTTTTTSQPPLVRKPPLGPSGSAGRGGGMTTGRGGVPPLRGTRGMAPRGGPLRQPPTKPMAPPLSGGVSIMGAASKRPREESSTTSDDSLAKRLKPAEPTS